MTAPARTLTDADVEAIADAVARRLRPSRSARPTPADEPPAVDELAMRRAREALEAAGLVKRKAPARRRR